MPILTLSNEVSASYKKNLEEAKNNNSAHIKVVEDTVEVTIPVSNDMSKVLKFSKLEMKKLIEELYIS